MSTGLNLGLQGGGAHGAFTWGVLDSLLADSRIEFDSVSGTSAGAMNAVVMASGYLNGGREGARNSLKKFWENVASMMPANFSPMPVNNATKNLQPYQFSKHISQFFTPSQLNPFNINPLRAIVKKHIDFELLQKYSPINLYISATQANTGRLKVFSTKEINSDVLLASACLPSMSPAVMIDDEPYWDGGISANPAMFPLFNHSKTRDILIIMLHPLRYKNLPNDVTAMNNRFLEISMNAAFLREMQMFARLSISCKNAKQANLQLGEIENKFINSRFHLIEADPLLQELFYATKISASMKIILQLCQRGKECGENWLDKNYDQIGKSSTVNLEDIFIPN